VKIELKIGAYEARSIIADCQKCINLYYETAPPDSPFSTIHYPTPGTLLLTACPIIGPVRAIYTAYNGNFYAVVGANVFAVSTAYGWTLLGQLTTGTGFVSIKDNTLACVIVDGSPTGFTINLADNSFGQISATNFFGASRVDYIDTYLVFNRPGTNQFYFTLSNATYAMLVGGTAFDPLDIAAKTGGNDIIVGIAIMHRELWLIGGSPVAGSGGTSEVWFDAGAADFAFQAMPGSFVEHGCTAVGSIAKYDLSLYWLGQDSSGASIVFEGAQYRVNRISTHAIEKDIATYSDKGDALGFTYLQEGHIFYVLIFPSANVTWVYDILEKHWHRRCWSDEDGNLNRWRANCFAVFNNQLIVGDFENGSLYALDLNTYLDNGDPIVRIRSFPHITNENRRLSHRNLIAAMEVGDEMGTSTDDEFQVSLRWSDDAGRSYGPAVLQSLGATGEYLTSVQWNRLGLARDRVYELSWSAPMKTSLQGVYLDVLRSKT
jgi:hypothetical protein